MSAPMGYSRAQIALHWIVAVLIVPQFVLHDGIAAAWDKIEDGIAVGFDPLVAGHVFGGIAILALVVWRLALRARRGAPPPPEAEHPALKLVAKATHGGLYLLLIVMPVSGLVAWFGGVETAAEAHETMKIALLALVVLHVAGALYQQFVLKTNLMERMKRPA
ncbi:MAG: cytochrome b/b6 domain-containing protein [Rhodobacteraceae bacterium]|nr:cytochrome b/b6 domain-containing protein [Paracoccaceae bacterium]